MTLRTWNCFLNSRFSLRRRFASMAFFRTIRVRSMESGFSRKSKAPELGGSHGGLDVAMAGDHDHFGMIFALDQLFQRFQPVHARKPDVEQHDVGGFVPEDFEAFFAAAGE